MASRLRERSDYSNCLPNLLQALEWRGTMRNFAEALPHFDVRLSLEGFRRVMANLYFTCKVIKAKLGDIDESLLPCLFVAEDGHAMVLLEYDPGQGFKVFDGVLRRLRARILSYMGARGEYIIASSIFQRILSLPAWSIEQVPVGSQDARIKDFESLRDLFVGPLALMAYELPGTAVYVIVLTMVDNWLLIIMVMSAL